MAIMNKQRSILTIILLLFCSCSLETEQSTGTSILIDTPNHWIEITNQNNSWIYFLPCRFIRELQTIDITRVNGQDAIIWNDGAEGQWYKIKYFQKENDSTYFYTVLPFDTATSFIFTVNYLDKEKNIVNWRIKSEDFSTIVTFIPKQDTIKYKKVIENCD